VSLLASRKEALPADDAGRVKSKGDRSKTKKAVESLRSHVKTRFPRATVPETPQIKHETPKSWTRRIPPARQPFMTDTSVAAVTTARLDRAGEVGHCWFIQTAREISRKRNGSRHSDIGSSHYRRRQGLSPAVSDRSSFRAIRDVSTALGAEKSPCRNSDGAGPVQSFCVSTSVKLSFLEETPGWTAHNAS